MSVKMNEVCRACEEEKPIVQGESLCEECFMIFDYEDLETMEKLIITIGEIPEEIDEDSDDDSDDGCICEEDKTNKDCPSHNCCKICSQGKKCKFNDVIWWCADCEKETEDLMNEYSDSDDE